MTHSNTTRSIKMLGVAGAIFALQLLPAAAQDINLNPLGLDLDPFHILTPAPAPAAAAAAKRVHHHHHAHHSHHKAHAKK